MGPREHQEWPLVNSSRANLQFSVCQQPPSASATLSSFFYALRAPVFCAKGEKAKGQPTIYYTAAESSMAMRFDLITFISARAWCLSVTTAQSELGRELVLYVEIRYRQFVRCAGGIPFIRAL